MAKQTKVKAFYEVPPYKDLLNGNKVLNSCLVACVGEDKWFRFTKPEAQHFPKDKIAVQHNNWDAFDETLPTKEVAIEKHKAVFGKEPAKTLEKFEITQVIWFHMATKAEDRTNVIAETKADGSKKRKSTLGTRIYKLKADPPKDALENLKTPQMLVCFNILKESLDDKGEVTEAVLKEKVYERQAEIKTRQDAWRIFQYYRPQLAQRGLIQWN